MKRPDRQKDRQIEKDIPRGTANCDVLQESCETGSGHVAQSSPIALKRKQLQEDAQYQDGAINRTREKSTTRKRAAKDTKPI